MKEADEFDQMQIITAPFHFFRTKKNIWNVTSRYNVILCLVAESETYDFDWVFQFEVKLQREWEKLRGQNVF